MARCLVLRNVKFGGVLHREGAVTDVPDDLLADLPPGTVSQVSWDIPVEEVAAPEMIEVPPSQPAKNAEGLLLNGPTLEEYVGAGNLATTYPPAGYAEVPSPGLEDYRAEQRLLSDAAEAGSGGEVDHPTDAEAVAEMDAQLAEELAHPDAVDHPTTAEAEAEMNAQLADEMASKKPEAPKPSARGRKK